MERFLNKGLVTTILGLGIIIFAGLMMYEGKASANEMSGWIATGILFLRSKDSLIGIPKKDNE